LLARTKAKFPSLTHKSALNVLKSLRKREEVFFHGYGELIMRLIEREREREIKLTGKEY
jgi:hypothetical protein